MSQLVLNATNSFKEKFFTIEKSMKKYDKYVNFALLVVAALVIFAMNVSAASNDDTFGTWATWMIEKLQGSGGFVLGVIALIATIWNAMMGNLKWTAYMLIVVLFATKGPDVLKSMFSFVF